MIICNHSGTLLLTLEGGRFLLGWERLLTSATGNNEMYFTALLQPARVGSDQPEVWCLCPQSVFWRWSFFVEILQLKNN